MARISTLTIFLLISKGCTSEGEHQDTASSQSQSKKNKNSDKTTEPADVEGVQDGTGIRNCSITKATFAFLNRIGDNRRNYALDIGQSVALNEARVPPQGRVAVIANGEESFVDVKNLNCDQSKYNKWYCDPVNDLSGCYNEW